MPRACANWYWSGRSSSSATASLSIAVPAENAAAAMYLAKAKEFLLAAEIFEGEQSMVHVRTSLACLSGISSASCILTTLVGQVAWGEDHNQSVTLLRKKGQGDAAKQLAALIPHKNPAQYHPKRSQEKVAVSTLEAASKLYELASEVYASGE